MILPSKELLSEVLGERIREFDIKGSVLEIIVLRDCNFAPYNHPPRIQKDCGIIKDINIYELAHKCKEWAMARGYFIYSSCDGDTILINDDGNDITKFADQPQADTEPESVTKACEWLLIKLKG
jgi:hypothetical protein